MTKEQAIQIIKAVCATYKGTLEEHTNIQRAIAAVQVVEEPVVVEPEAKIEEAMEKLKKEVSEKPAK